MKILYIIKYSTTSRKFLGCLDQWLQSGDLFEAAHERSERSW